MIKISSAAQKPKPKSSKTSHRIAKDIPQPKSASDPTKTPAKKPSAAQSRRKGRTTLRGKATVAAQHSDTEGETRYRRRSTANLSRLTKQAIEPAPGNIPASSSQRKVKQPGSSLYYSKIRQEKDQGASSPQPLPTSLQSSPAALHTEHNWQFQGRDQSFNPPTALTEAALGEHTRTFKPTDIVDRLRNFKRISGAVSTGNQDDARSSGQSSIDPQELFNYKWGFLPPLDKEVEWIIAAVLEDPTLAKIIGRISPDNRNFQKGLEQRNVSQVPSLSPDPRADEIRKLALTDFLPERADQQRCHDELWHSDLAKCTTTSSEALFQRTLMVSLIGRHSSIFQQSADKAQILDYSVEEPWTSLPMPTRSVWKVPETEAYEHRFLSQPKPDLAVCFDRACVIPENVWRKLPEATQALACIENTTLAASRVFHFLTIEAKNGDTGLGDRKALRQNLNNASQALHNMFEFFRDAGSRHERIFFEKVRFFSVVANSSGLVIRIHRAVEIPKHEDNFLLIMPNDPGYRLKFESREFRTISGADEYCRGVVLNTFKNIFKYAVDELAGWIRDAALDLAEKLKDVDAPGAKRPIHYYRHSQPSPKPATMKTPLGTLYTSANDGFSTVNQKIRNANMISNGAQSNADNSMVSERIVPTPQQPQRSSRLPNSARKRRKDEVETMSVDAGDSQDINERSKTTRRLRQN